MSAQAEQQLRFKKCVNEGCEVMIAFKRKTDGSNGWSVLEKDSLGQLVTHICKGKRVPRAQTQTSQQTQPQQPQQQDLGIVHRLDAIEKKPNNVMNLMELSLKK